MTSTFNITEKNEKSLAAIRDESVDRLTSVLEALSHSDKILVNLSALRKQIEKKLNPDTAKALTEQLIGLVTVSRRRQENVDNLVDSLTESIRLTDWNEDELQKWEEKVDIIKKLSKIDNVVSVCKVIDLSYDYVNLFDTARILVDIRPIFDHDRSHIRSSIISQTLRLDYTNNGRPNSLSIAMDMADVKQLRLACDEAIDKAKRADELMSKVDIESVFPGEDDDNAE